jgi:hypothetical protein
MNLSRRILSPISYQLDARGHFKWHNVFKQHGGRLTAENENLCLLATLPLVPEVVSKGDSGDMSLLGNRDHPVTQAFNNLVDEIVMLNAPGTIRLVEPAA